MFPRLLAFEIFFVVYGEGLDLAVAHLAGELITLEYLQAFFLPFGMKQVLGVSHLAPSNKGIGIQKG